LDTEEFKRMARPREGIDRDRYEIYDYEMGNLVISLTVLYPKRETRGHSHPWEEVYFFSSSGFGTMIVGEERIPITRGDTVLVPKDAFHRVINTMNTVALEFYCVWRRREE